jgi:hypothetical protein
MADPAHVSEDPRIAALFLAEKLVLLSQRSYMPKRLAHGHDEPGVGEKLREIRKAVALQDVDSRKLATRLIEGVAWLFPPYL